MVAAMPGLRGEAEPSGAEETPPYFTASLSGTGSEEIILKITRTECLQSCVLSRYRTPCIGFCLEEFWIRACYEKAISCASRGAGRWVTRFRKSILSCLQIPLALPGGG